MLSGKELVSIAFCLVFAFQLMYPKELQLFSSDFDGSFSEAMRKGDAGQKALLERYCLAFETIVNSSVPHLGYLNDLYRPDIIKKREGIERVFVEQRESCEMVFRSIRKASIPPARVAIDRNGGFQSLYFEHYPCQGGDQDIIKLMLDSRVSAKMGEYGHKEEYIVQYYSAKTLNKYPNYKRTRCNYDLLSFACQRTMGNVRYYINCTWFIPALHFSSTREARQYATDFHNWLFIYDYSNMRTLDMYKP